MKCLKYSALIVFLGAIIQINLSAQQEVHNIALLAKSYQDSIVLRWGISHINAWDLTQSAGYYIERMELDDESNDVKDNFKRLTSSPIKPWSKEEFHQLTIKGDSMTALAYKCLYQPSKEGREATDFITQLSMISADRNSRFTMSMLAADMSAKAATAQGLRFIDRDVKPGIKYIYRIFSPIDSSSVRTDSSYFVIRTDDYYKETAMLRPDAYAGDRQILVRWLTEKKYSGYFLERSEDGKNYKPASHGPVVPWLNEKGKPFDHLTFNDSIPINNKTYYYRISGITAFAEMSPWSQAVEIKGKDDFHLQPPRMTSGENTIGLQMDLEWIVDESFPIAGFYISHAHSGFSKNFTPVHDQMLSPDSRAFTHVRASEFDGNSYRITVIYENGQVYTSMPYHAIVADQAPPSRPRGLTGTIDENGIVTLSWLPNAEQDLTGYFVLLANQADHEFMNLTPFVIQQTTFKDTVNLNTLTEEVFYKIQAKDRSGKISEYSDTLFIKRPDIIAPSAPVIKDYKVRDTTLYLAWNGSTSKDLKHHVLVMRESGQDWQTIKTYDKGIFEDNLPLPGSGIVEFSLYAVDDADLQSEHCFPIGVKSIRKKKKLQINEFNTEIINNSRCSLSWSAGFKEMPGKYILYRSVDGSPLKKFKILKYTHTSFEDTKIESGKAYTYELQFRSDDGRKSHREKRAVVIN